MLLLTLHLIAAYAEGAPIKILMIGNSYTEGAKDELVHLLDVANIQYIFEAHNPGATTLTDHAGSQIVENLLNSMEWGVVVLQDQSVSPANASRYYGGSPSYESYYVVQGAINLAQKVYAANPNTRIVWFSTPAYQTGNSYLNAYFNNDMSVMNGHTSYYYHYFRDNFSAANSQVAETGEAFLLSYNTVPSRILHAGDKSHHSNTGQYLIACVFFDTITKKSSEGLSDQSNVAPADRVELQSIFKQVSQGKSTDWGGDLWYYDSVSENLYPVNGLDLIVESVSWIPENPSPG